MSVELTGDQSAAVALDKRTTVCTVLYADATGTWKEHAKFRGKAPDVTFQPPTTLSTTQGLATSNDLKELGKRLCP